MTHGLLLKSGKTHFVLIRFLFVGCLLTATYVIICTALAAVLLKHRFFISVGVHSALIPIGFLLQRNVAFRSDGTPHRQFLRYTALQIFSITASSAVLTHLLVENPFINAAIFTAIAGLAALVSFLICRLFVFS